METKIRNFIHHNDANYSSYSDMKSLFVCVFLFLSLIVGVFPVVDGLWWGVCVLVALDVTFLLYLIILKHLKKTYRLRFLSEGIVATLLSLLFLSSAYIILFTTKCNTPALTYGTLISYLIFVMMLLISTICFSKSNIFQSDRNASLKKHHIFLGSLIPLSGVFGTIIAKIAFKTFDFENQVAVYLLYAIFVIVSLLFSFGYSNYVKYYYCIKYKVFCDEFGNALSPDLENMNNKKRIRSLKKEKKKIHTVFRIIIGIVFIPIVLLFIVSFIRVMIERS